MPTPSEAGPDIPIDDVSPENQVPWSPGDAVGRYSLLAKIATGGMAEIWLAKQGGPRGFEKVIVIKRIVDSLSADPDFVEMFLDEARIAAQLNHPNIVQIYDLGEHAGAYYIAMEYLAGENLATIARHALKAGLAVPIVHATKIISACAEGLGHAHTRHGVKGHHLGVVHRDVSPQNIIITYDGLVKLLDFGIAKAANRGSQTMGGQIKGKVAYMAPEQALGQTIDHRADLFSLATVLYELVTRTRLFHRDDQHQALAAVTSPEPVQRADVRNPDVPEELADILALALQKDPADRYQDALAFHHALEDWLKKQPDGPTWADISEFMKKLFTKRINARARLIETAAMSELTPSSAALVRSDTDKSMPGRTGNRTAPAPNLASPSRAAVVLVPSALALLLAGILLARMLLHRDEPVPAPRVVVVQPEKVVLPQSGTLIIESDPPGADVTIDGLLSGKTPLTVEQQSLGAHQITSWLPGHKQMSTTVTLTEPGARAQVMMPLPVEVVVEPKVDVKTDPVAVKRAPVAPQNGKLSLSTQPWTHVFFNGKALGDTPIIDVTMPAGKHTLKLTNEDQSINTSIEVEVKAGQTTKKVLKL